MGCTGSSPHISLFNDSHSFATEIVKRCKATLYVDSNRELFLVQNACTIYQLINNQLVNSTRHRCTLLGRKNIGKTLLLTTFSRCVEELVGDKVLTVRLSCDRDRRNLYKIENPKGF